MFLSGYHLDPLNLPIIHADGREKFLDASDFVTKVYAAMLSAVAVHSVSSRSVIVLVALLLAGPEIVGLASGCPLRAWSRR